MIRSFRPVLCALALVCAALLAPSLAAAASGGDATSSPGYYLDNPTANQYNVVPPVCMGTQTPSTTTCTPPPACTPPATMTSTGSCVAPPTCAKPTMPAAGGHCVHPPVRPCTGPATHRPASCMLHPVPVKPIATPIKTTPTVSDKIQDFLPFTGMPLQGVLLLGLVLVAVGVVMAFVGRRRPDAG